MLKKKNSFSFLQQKCTSSTGFDKKESTKYQLRI